MKEMKGWVRKDAGYRRLRVGKEQFQYHRVMYYCFNNDWDIRDVSINNLNDHIDRNPLNNNIDNLRVVTHQQNQQNRNNTKGFTYRKDRPNTPYQAKICINNKQNKRFLQFLI